MKKYIFSIPYIEYHEACLNLFNEMNTQGYELVKIGLFFVFEKTDRNIKYEMSYVSRNDEYDSIVREMGYEYIGSCSTTHFYKTTCNNAPSLETDEVVLKNKLLNKYNSTGFAMIIFCLVMLFLAFAYVVATLRYMNNRIYFYENAQDIPVFLFFTLFMVYEVFLQISNYLKRKAVINDRFCYEKFHKLDMIILSSLAITFIISILSNLYFKGSLLTKYIAVHWLIIYPIFYYISFYRVSSVVSSKRRNMISLISTILFIIISLNVIDQSEKVKPIHYISNEDVVEIIQNRFLYKVTAFKCDEVSNNVCNNPLKSVYREFKDDEIKDDFIKIHMNSLSNYNAMNISDYPNLDYLSFDENNHEYILIYDRLYVCFKHDDKNTLNHRINEFIDYYHNNKQFD